MKYRLWVFLLFISLVAGSIIFFLRYEPDTIRHFKSHHGLEGDYIIEKSSHAQGILLWLHGDGAEEFKHPDSKEYLAGPDGIRAVAKKKHLTLVVPRTPSGETWWKSGEKNADYLVDLIATLPAHQKLWIGGFSGGAEITTYWLIPHLKNLDITSGGAVMFGGGGSPEVEGIADSVKKESIVEGNFPLFWIVGEKDSGNPLSEQPFNALKVSEQGENFYKKQGWKTKRIIVKNQGHLLSEDDGGLYGEFLDGIIR